MSEHDLYLAIRAALVILEEYEDGTFDELPPEAQARGVKAAIETLNIAVKELACHVVGKLDPDAELIEVDQ